MGWVGLGRTFGEELEGKETSYIEDKKPKFQVMRSGKIDGGSIFLVSQCKSK